ncbi:MAG: polysaccharide biosynthesis C-terminal domain-containing protein [Agriterribacter sp.]
MIAALMVYPNLFMSIGSLGIQQSTTYFVGQKKYSIDEIYGSVLAIWMFTNILSMGVCIILIQYFTHQNYSLVYMFLAIIGIPFTLYTNYSAGIFLGLQKIKEFNKINWVPVAINFVATLFLVVVLKLGVLGSMIGTFSGALIMSFVVGKRISRYVSLKPVFNFSRIKEMLALGITYAVALLVANINYFGDIVILERLSTTSEIGLYTKGSFLAHFLWEVPMLMSSLIFSRSAAAKDRTDFSNKTCRLLRFAGVVMLIGCISLYFLSPLVIYLLYGKEFEGSSSVLRLLLPGIFLLTIFKVLYMDILGRGKPWLSMKAMIPSAILNIILNIIWVPSYGANGSAVASAISYSFAAILFLWIYSVETGISIKNILTFTSTDKEIVMSYLSKIKKVVNGKP